MTMVRTLVRQYRLPSGIARGWAYNRKTKKDQGWFRSLPKKTTEHMGQVLIQAYTPWLVHIRAAELRLREDEDKVARDLALASAPKGAA